MMSKNSKLTFNGIFAVAACMILLSIVLSFLQDMRYNICWIMSGWTRHQYLWIENCVNDGYIFWEQEFANKQHFKNQVDLSCPMIDGEKLFAMPMKERHKLFQELSSNGQQPLQIKNGVPYFTNELFDISFFLNKLPDSVNGCITKLLNGETIGVNTKNLSLHEYIKNINRTDALFDGYHRRSILEVENILPELTSTLFNDNLLYTIFGENWMLKRMWRHSKEQSSDLLLGIGKIQEKNKRNFHGDLFDNINIQLSGVKDWILVDSKYLFQFRPRLAKNKIKTHMNLHDQTPLNWDMIPRMYCTMETNDILYVPMAYLHKVDYPDLSYQSNTNDTLFSISLVGVYSYLNRLQLFSNHWQTGLGLLNNMDAEPLSELCLQSDQ